MIFIYILFTNKLNQSRFFIVVLMRANKHEFRKRSWLDYVNEQNIPVSILVSNESDLDIFVLINNLFVFIITAMKNRDWLSLFVNKKMYMYIYIWLRRRTQDPRSVGSNPSQAAWTRWYFSEPH